MNNEMISQLQFDQIKKEVQARAIGNYSKKRISKMTASSTYKPSWIVKKKQEKHA